MKISCKKAGKKKFLPTFIYLRSPGKLLSAGTQNKDWVYQASFTERFPFNLWIS